MTLLNRINIQLVLYFFYLNIAEEEQLTCDEIIDNIRQDYSKYFYESMNTEPMWQNVLLNSNVNQVEFSTMLWEIDIRKEITKYFYDKENRMNVCWDKYKNVLRYFEQCREEATSLIQKLNINTFSYYYPYLLGIESKCQLMIKELVYLIEWELNEDEQDLLARVEDEYISNVHERLKFIYTKFDKESLRYVVS